MKCWRIVLLIQGLRCYSNFQSIKLLHLYIASHFFPHYLSFTFSAQSIISQQIIPPMFLMWHILFKLEGREPDKGTYTWQECTHMKAYCSTRSIKQMTSWKLPVSLTSREFCTAQEGNVACSVHSSTEEKKSNFKNKLLFSPESHHKGLYFCFLHFHP